MPLNDREAENIKVVLKELETVSINGNPHVSLKSVLRILSPYREHNDNWDLITIYDDTIESYVWWIGASDKILTARDAYEANMRVKKEAEKKEQQARKAKKLSFFKKLFGGKSTE